MRICLPTRALTSLPPTFPPRRPLQVIDIITAEVMPMLRESGMSGQVEYFSDLRIFNDHLRSAQASVGREGWRAGLGFNGRPPALGTGKCGKGGGAEGERGKEEGEPRVQRPPAV